MMIFVGEMEGKKGNEERIEKKSREEKRREEKRRGEDKKIRKKCREGKDNQR